VTLVAVSKTVPPERLRTAVEQGQVLFGENRVQEAEPKIPEVPGAHWRLVGHLQSNKVRKALALFEAIESVDSVALAERIDRVAGELREQGVTVPWTDRVPVFVQANVDADPDKAGFAPADLELALPSLAGLAGLELAGLMTVGRLAAHAEQSRPTFRRLRELSERLRSVESRLGPGLSMGMSDDFEVAVEEGATVVRVGRALFGERPPA
jgi:PLP dependent protein